MIERAMIGAALAALITALYLTTPDTIEEQAQLDRYCEMVEVWDETSGEYGWPPYKGREGCEQ